MLTRVSKPRVGTSPEACSVAGRAKAGRPRASSARTSRSARCRHVGSDTKRARADGLPATFPRGDSEAANLGASRPQGPVGGNARVFVLDKKKRPLMPCHPARARELLRKGRAVVVRLHPFTIRIKNRIGGEVQTVSFKIDPGSKVTGIAVARESKDATTALWLGELKHRGQQIHKAMGQRAGYRRRRRSTNLRYRAPRFSDRRPARGRLAPSLQHRVETTMTWARRICAICPVNNVQMELVRFDMQALQNPEISGVEYQQGELAGYEVREYLLEKWGRRCAYCATQDVPLQIEHIVSRARGGSDRVSNLALACEPCNQKKDARPVEEFLASKTALLAKILAQAKAPLRDAAAINATRWKIKEALGMLGLPIHTASGGRTKWNRSRFAIPKTHALDALCVGEVKAVRGWQMPALSIKATGRGSYQRTQVTASGFPRGYLTRSKRAFGFQTGDLVRAVVPSGKKRGTHLGRVAVRATGSFNVQTAAGVVQGISHKHCRLLMLGDGYTYATKRSKADALLPGLKAGVHAKEIR